MKLIDELRHQVKETNPTLNEEKKRKLEDWFFTFSLRLETEMGKEAKKGNTSLQISDKCLSEDEVNYLYKHYKDEGFEVKISGPYCVYGESIRLITISWEEPVCL